MKPERTRSPKTTAPLITVAVILGAALPVVLALLLITEFSSSGSEAEPTPTPETVIVPLNRVISTLTEHDYRGKVRLIIAGSGQVEGTALCDAFYCYTDDQGQPLDLPEPTAFPLKIDGRSVLDLADAPSDYQADHLYTMIYDAGSKAHAISFALSDPHARDNTGQFTIDVVPLD